MALHAAGMAPPGLRPTKAPRDLLLNGTPTALLTRCTADPSREGGTDHLKQGLNRRCIVEIF
jgi:hypothetical protein